MNCNRSETLALASEKCSLCLGMGLRRTAVRGKETPCNCVLRGIFRACFSRFRQCAEKEQKMSQVSWDFFDKGASGRRSYGLRDEEYMADFCITAKRNLDELEYKIFRFHFLLGADWKLCCRQLKMDRGAFFHAVYRIQQNLGRVFRELETYALFPLDEYFGGKITKSVVSTPKVVAMVPKRAKRDTVRPPLRKVA